MRMVEKKNANGKREKRKMNAFFIFMQRAKADNKQYFAEKSNSEAIKELSLKFLSSP